MRTCVATAPVGSTIVPVVRTLTLLLALSVAFALPGSAAEPQHLGKTLSEWRSDLGSEVQVVRLIAARAIGEMAIADRTGSRDALVSALAHGDGAVRYWSTVALAEIEEAASLAQAQLATLLEDSVPEVRVQAAVASIRSGQPDRALATLETLLKHRNRGVRLQAVHAADSVGESARPIAKALHKAVEDDFDYVQRVARHALWRLGERPCPYRECK